MSWRYTSTPTTATFRLSIFYGATPKLKKKCREWRISKYIRNSMASLDIFQFSTVEVGTCRKCVKLQRKAWGSKYGSPDLCVHQKAKLRRSIEGRFLISSSTTRQTIKERDQKRRSKKRKRARMLKPIKRLSHSTRKTTSYYVKTKPQKRISVSNLRHLFVL